MDQILSYREMCDEEGMQTLQRGMNFRLSHEYSVILMSRRTNAPYRDKILEDGITIEYEGHDVAKTSSTPDPKKYDQPRITIAGKPTQNGMFIEAINKFKKGQSAPELIKVYEKILPGIWSKRGLFDLIDYRVENDGQRNVFIFVLRLTLGKEENGSIPYELAHTRLIPTEVKKFVWQRDKGKCVLCGSAKNLHFDHDLPFSKGGTSLMERNIRLLCAKCNLAKSDKIE